MFQLHINFRNRRQFFNPFQELTDYQKICWSLWRSKRLFFASFCSLRWSKIIFSRKFCIKSSQDFFSLKKNKLLQSKLCHENYFASSNSFTGFFSILENMSLLEIGKDFKQKRVQKYIRAHEMLAQQLLTKFKQICSEEKQSAENLFEPKQLCLKF